MKYSSNYASPMKKVNRKHRTLEISLNLFNSRCRLQTQHFDKLHVSAQSSRRYIYVWKLHVAVYTAVTRQRIYSKWKVRPVLVNLPGEASNAILICLDERTGSITQLEVVDPSMTHPEALRIHVAIPQGRDKTPEWHGSFKAFLVNRTPWYQPPKLTTPKTCPTGF